MTTGRINQGAARALTHDNVERQAGRLGDTGAAQASAPRKSAVRVATPRGVRVRQDRTQALYGFLSKFSIDDAMHRFFPHKDRALYFRSVSSEMNVTKYDRAPT